MGGLSNPMRRGAHCEKMDILLNLDRQEFLTINSYTAELHQSNVGNQLKI